MRKIEVSRIPNTFTRPFVVRVAGELLTTLAGATRKFQTEKAAIAAANKSLK